MNELEELDKFKSMIFAILSTGQDQFIRCADASEAKKLRKRLYRLRDSLDVLEKDTAKGVAFSVVGHRIRCSASTIRRDHSLENWTDNVELGVPNAHQD